MAYDLTGGISVAIVIVMAAVAVSESAENRLKKILLADSSLMLPSVIMTPVGWWIKRNGFHYIHWILFGASGLVAFVGLVCFIFYENQILPETGNWHVYSRMTIKLKNTFKLKVLTKNVLLNIIRSLRKWKTLFYVIPQYVD